MLLLIFSHLDGSTLLIFDKLLHFEKALLKISLDKLHDFDVSWDLWLLLLLLHLELLLLLECLLLLEYLLLLECLLLLLLIIPLSSLSHGVDLFSPVLSHLLFQKDETLNENLLLILITVLDATHGNLAEFIKVA